MRRAQPDALGDQLRDRLRGRLRVVVFAAVAFRFSERSTRGTRRRKRLAGCLLGEPVQQEPQRVRLVRRRARTHGARAQGRERAEAPAPHRERRAPQERQQDGKRTGVADGGAGGDDRLGGVSLDARRGGREVGVDGELQDASRERFGDGLRAPRRLQRVREGVVPDVPFERARGGLGPGKQTPQRAHALQRRRFAPGSAVFDAALGVQEAHHLHVRRGRVRAGAGGRQAQTQLFPSGTGQRGAQARQHVGQRPEALASRRVSKSASPGGGFARRRQRLQEPADQRVPGFLRLQSGRRGFLETAAASAAAAGDERDQGLHRERARLRAPQQLGRVNERRRASAPAERRAAVLERGGQKKASRRAQRNARRRFRFPHPRRARSKLSVTSHVRPPVQNHQAQRRPPGRRRWAAGPHALSARRRRASASRRLRAQHVAPPRAAPRREARHASTAGAGGAARATIVSRTASTPPAAPREVRGGNPERVRVPDRAARDARASSQSAKLGRRRRTRAGSAGAARPGRLSRRRRRRPAAAATRPRRAERRGRHAGPRTSAAAREERADVRAE